ncbi:uncharacterized protein LOC129947743 isoform X1 [Eupeodes corollae]|uniref:uncharacterized protein LOC129947743 isoform X1 n=1 Tax=Eupeodes corollae TaxID=290404 RepID=UPI00248F82A5|nr:uncharacterized protein LOC129947743 isoform X1 [Eupeodes corollae]XP_055914392.1 uncharacterized protein LOC129947743 isoform X1 [Eupeodes corollae]XP_055914393.1 uncharacterized protein LOC129947743 isoform X1 [Eupeodes corollae]
MLCFVCNNKCTNFSLLMHHLKKRHNLNCSSTYRCLECNLLFDNSSSYKRHMLRLHSTLNISNSNEFQAQACSIKPEDSNRVTTSSEQSSCINVKGISVEEKLVLPSSLSSCQKSKKENFDEEIKNMRESAFKFSLSLHTNDNFSRKDVVNIQKSVSTQIVAPLLQIFDSFSKTRICHDHEALNEISTLISSCKHLFDDCASDYLLLQKLKKSGYMNDVEEFVINNEMETVFHCGELSLDENLTKGVVLPLRSQFKLLFETNNFLKAMLQYMEMLEKSDRIRSFINGELWKEKVKMYPNKLLVPYFLYGDDFEINNPLGSHSSVHSVCNFYYSFPCMPIKESKLDNVFLAAVIRTRDMKKFGNSKCLVPLVNELKFLEQEGLSIEASDGQVYRIHFILGLVLGDNLGLNSIMGFNKSFSGVFCRFCRLDKDKCKTMCFEDPNKMRNILNYNEDVLQNNNQLTGISSFCPFNAIPSFHAIENYSVDVMHDLFEGICHYDLCHILLNFIQIKKYFSLQVLNKRKQTFEYGPHEIGNISNEISQTHLQKRHLRMSAREMLCFIQYLPIMIGDLVPIDDDVWHFLLNLIEIIDLTLCFEINDFSISSLKNKIQLHHEQYLLLFKDSLKPKFHILTHYPTILKKSGPPRNFWCFKYEAKHKNFKIYSRAITSRKNICLTLAKKFQLGFANKILNSNDDDDKHEFFKENKIKTGFSSLISKKMGIQEENLEYLSKTEINGYKFQTGYYVSKLLNDYKIFVIVALVQHLKKIVLFCQEVSEVLYDPHFTAYDINPSILGKYSIIDPDEIVGPPITAIKTAKGRIMIRIKDYTLQEIDKYKATDEFDTEIKSRCS